MMPGVRIWSLVITCLILALLYWFAVVMTMMPDYCVGFFNLWFAPESEPSLFRIFTFIFALLSLWALLELAVFLMAWRWDAVRAASIGMVLLFVTTLCLVHYTLWQSWQIDLGRLAVRDFAVKFLTDLESVEYYRDRARSRRRHYFSPLPSWREFMDANTCAVGIEWSQLTREQRIRLSESFDAMWEEYYRDKELREIQENMLRHYGLKPGGGTPDRPQDET